MIIDILFKGVSCQFVYDGVIVIVIGISKGVGMIKLNMVIMFGYIVIDVKVVQGVLQDLLCDVVNKFFNCIIIDGDIFINDCCMLIVIGCVVLLEVIQVSGVLFVVLK